MAADVPHCIFDRIFERNSDRYWIGIAQSEGSMRMVGSAAIK